MLRNTTEAYYSTVTQLSILCPQSPILVDSCRYLSTDSTTNTSLEYSSRIKFYFGNVQLQIQTTIDVVADAAETEHLDALYPISSNLLP